MQIAKSVFIVTGGASGLGAATARMLVDEGAKVVLADVNDAQGNALSAELGAATRFVRTDVTDEASAKAAVAAAQSAFGMLHGLINCAGIAIGERVVGKEGPHALVERLFIDDRRRLGVRLGVGIGMRVHLSILSQPTVQGKPQV